MKITIKGKSIDVEITDIDLRLDDAHILADPKRFFHKGLIPHFSAKTEDGKEFKFSDLEGSTGIFGKRPDLEPIDIVQEFIKAFNAEKAKNFPEAKISCEIVDVDYALHSSTYHFTFLFNGSYDKQPSDVTEIKQTEKNVHLTSLDEQKGEIKTLYKILKNMDVLSQGWNQTKFVDKVNQLNSISVKDSLDQCRERYKKWSDNYYNFFEQARLNYIEEQKEQKEQKEQSFLHRWMLYASS